MIGKVTELCQMEENSSVQSVGWERFITLSDMMSLIQKPGVRVVNDLMKRLKEKGSVGLDLSPGDPLCMEAYRKIKELQGIIKRTLVTIETLRGTLDEKP